MMEVALLAGVAATTGAILVAVGTALVSYRVGLDPDNYGIPMVTSSLDLLGAGALITALAALGVR
jgi:mgtE-like transporter